MGTACDASVAGSSQVCRGQDDVGTAEEAVPTLWLVGVFAQQSRHVPLLEARCPHSREERPYVPRRILTGSPLAA